MLTVETGYGLAGTDSYASVADADAYWQARGGNPTWDASTNQRKEVGLRLASDFIDAGPLSGREPLADGQGRAWPFEGSEFSLSALAAVQRATVMLAPVALASGGMPTPRTEPAVLSRSERVGELSESFQYAAPSSEALVMGSTDVSWLYGVLRAVAPGGSLVVGRRQRA